MKKHIKKFSKKALEISLPYEIQQQFMGGVPLIGVTKKSHIRAIIDGMHLVLKQEEMDKLEKYAEATGISIKASWE